MKKDRIIIAIILIIVLVAIVGGCVKNKNEVSESPSISEQMNNEDSPEDDMVPDDENKATSDIAEKYEPTPTPVKTAEVTTTPEVTEGIDDVVESSKEPVAKVSEEPAPTKMGVKNTPTPVPTKVVAQNTPTPVPTKVEIVDVKINPVSKTVYVVVEAAKLVADPNKSSVGSNVLLIYSESGDVSNWLYAPIKVSGITTDGMYYKGSYNGITGYIPVGCVTDALPTKQPSPTSTPIPTKGCYHSNTEAIEVYTTVPEEGHWETKAAWDEPVYEYMIICGECGYMTKIPDEIYSHTSGLCPETESGLSSYGGKTVIVDYIHHPESQVWVVDKQEGTVYEYLGWSCIDCGYKHYDEDCMNGTCGIH